MADLEALADRIYHEKQEHGSALCAQHALNSLLRVSHNPSSHVNR
jgi:ataxin-3